MTAIEGLLEGPVTASAIEAFLSQHEFPIVEGRRVTFCYRGDASEVFLQHWVHSLPQRQPLRRLAGSDFWYLTMELPPRSRIEYKMALGRGHRAAASQDLELVLDPLNPRQATDPFGANSVVHTEGYEVPEWTLADPEARPGELNEHEIASAAFGGRRPVTVYTPARYRSSRDYPLLIVHDGDDFLTYASLKTVLDNLIHRLEIPPLICALTSSPARLTEYPDDERHTAFLVDELLPEMQKRYSLAPDPAARGLLGSSFGAVASLAAAWRRPGVFDRLCLLSGSFVFTDVGVHEAGPVFDPVVEFMGELRRRPGRPARRIYMSCGVYEPMIYYNRSLVPLLQDTGMRVRFTEARDGHNWENWRDRLREGLAWLFRGPLWMVYE